MAPGLDDNDDFDLSSGDEGDCLALMDAIKRSNKRKISDSSLPFPKRIALEANMVSLASKALKQTFGMKGFRLKQEQVISRLLSGKSAVVVFPTGGGKSLCYQIPGIMLSEADKLSDVRGPGESGITLVVSPLIALMKDQTEALNRRGIKAATFDSTKTREEYLHTCDMLRNGELKLLYCAPERLNNEGFVAQMKHVRGGIRLVAVDEAHCISEWGHAFRPDYLKIARFVQEIEAERVVCLTATATPRVATDICKAFNIDEATGLFRTSTYRSNLHLLAVSAQTKQELYPHMFNFLRKNPGSSIVYVTLQQQTEVLADDLRRQGFKVRAFHAGLETSLKAKIQDEFMDCDDLIIVSTIAFGMGIDKSNVRSIIHFNIPSSVESYSQEIGRAGRDGKISKCVFYVCGEDLYLREIFSRGDLPSRESVKGLLNDIFDPATVKLPVGAEIKVSHYAQQKDFDIRSTTLSNIYAQLELIHSLIRATTPIYTKYSYIPGKTYAARLNADTSKAAIGIKKYAKMASKFYHIDIDLASRQLGIPRAEFVSKLNQWNETQVIELKPGGVLNVYKILRSLPKNPAEIQKISDELYEIMEKREHEALIRSEQVMSLITGNSCISRALAQHFGDDLPNCKKECGHCTWCETKKRVLPQVSPLVKFNWQAFNAILKAIPDRDDARFLTRVAFGITSPRVTAMKLPRGGGIFGSMGDHGFMELLRAFTKECSK